jgi:hypothetical protein
MMAPETHEHCRFLAGNNQVNSTSALCGGRTGEVGWRYWLKFLCFLILFFLSFFPDFAQ